MQRGQLCPLSSCQNQDKKQAGFDNAGAAAPGGRRPAPWSRHRSIRFRSRPSAADDLVGRLRRNRSAATGDGDPQCTAISHRQGAECCGGCVHPRAPQGSSQGGAADPWQPASPCATLRRHARCAEGDAGGHGGCRCGATSPRRAED